MTEHELVFKEICKICHLRSFTLLIIRAKCFTKLNFIFSLKTLQTQNYVSLKSLNYLAESKCFFSSECFYSLLHFTLVFFTFQNHKTDCSRALFCRCFYTKIKHFFLSLTKKRHAKERERSDTKYIKKAFFFLIYFNSSTSLR